MAETANIHELHCYMVKDKRKFNQLENNASEKKFNLLKINTGYKKCKLNAHWPFYQVHLYNLMQSNRVALPQILHAGVVCCRVGHLIYINEVVKTFFFSYNAMKKTTAPPPTMTSIINIIETVKITHVKVEFITELQYWIALDCTIVPKKLAIEYISTKNLILNRLHITQSRSKV